MMWVLLVLWGVFTALVFMLEEKERRDRLAKKKQREDDN